MQNSCTNEYASFLELYCEDNKRQTLLEISELGT